MNDLPRVELDYRAARPADETDADRLRQAIDMVDFSYDMSRQTLQRRHPEESDEQIETRIANWADCQPSFQFDSDFVRTDVG